MKKNILRLLPLLILTVLLCTSCFGSNSGGDDKGDSQGELRVTLVPSTGAVVDGSNPISVKDGGNATFTVKLGDTYVFRSAKCNGVDVGKFDFQTGKYTVGNVKSDMRIEFTVEDVGYNTTVGYSFFLRGTSSDSATHSNGLHQAGTRITVTAGLETGAFIGWSIGGELEDGKAPVSTDKEYTFELKGNTTIFANYADYNVYYYDANGGYINASSANISNSSYYSTTKEGSLLTVALKQTYLDRVPAASTFWDDGSFTRDGYVLKEYNTKADGSGEGYSLGSKFPLNLETKILYCIWEKATDQADFEYENYTFARPRGVSASTAPDWKENGVIITKYIGNAETVTIPEKIGGKYVIAIGEGAFLHRDVKTLVMGRYMLEIKDGAFVGCDKLTTIHYPDGIYSISNDALDAASYTSFKNFYVNATIAPRCSGTDAAFAMKFARLIANSDKQRIIVIAGSSAYQGLSSEYMQALLGGKYAVINFGTTRTTHGTLYLEAMSHYASDDDIVLYAPENSAYMMGDPNLYYKTLRDMEGMYNVFRYVDISNYENVFGAFCDFNQGLTVDEGADFAWTARYERAPGTYEQIMNATHMNDFGEYQYSKRADYYTPSNYKDAYIVTLNNRFKSRFEGAWTNVENQQQNGNYQDLSNATWCSVDDPYYKDRMNRIIEAAKSSGAQVYFSFSPVDYSSLCEEAKANPAEWLAAYDTFIESTYVFDGVLGTSADYVMNRRYFYDCAFHPNDYGRTYRTYTLYTDICELIGETNVKGIHDVGHSFEGCLFEENSTGKPIMPAY